MKIFLRYLYSYYNNMGKIPKKAKKSTKNEVYHFPLRLKQSTAEAVISRADSQNRSINGQIEYELDQK